MKTYYSMTRLAAPEREDTLAEAFARTTPITPAGNPSGSAKPDISGKIDFLMPA
ncbi:MAG: hypothetical protein ABI824_18315 [Acidobacteriota bacterium]